MKRRILSILMIFCMCMTQSLTMLPQEAVAAAENKEWPGNPRIRTLLKNGVEGYAWDCIFFGRYLQRDINEDGQIDDEDGALPIQWRVLSVDEKTGDAVLMASNLLDGRKYHDTDEYVTWETCSLRAWLNGEFLDAAFSDKEKAAIKKTTVVNESNPLYPSVSGGETTEDYIYIPSISDLTNPDYGFNEDYGSSYGRYGARTEYAETKTEASLWWVRNPGSDRSFATLVSSSYVGFGWTNSVTATYLVRPMLHVNLNLLEWENACPEMIANSAYCHLSYSEWEQGDIYGNGTLGHSRICTNETCCKVHDDWEVMERDYCSGGEASYTHGKICSTCGYEYTDPLEDDTPPTGTISIGADQWNDVVSGATFERFYNESKGMTITAEDGESGVASISYYLTDRELTKEKLEDIEDWQPTDANYEEEDDWKAEDTVTVTIKPDIECILYAKIVDGMGNTTYLSSDGMVFDGTAPKIEGVEDKGTYCAPQDIPVEVTDKYLDSVTLNGKNVALSEDGTSCTFALSKTEYSQTIEAADKAGNSTTVTVTMNEDHSFGEWDASVGKNRSKTCENCGQKYTETDEERVKAAQDIIEGFLENLPARNTTVEEDIRQKIEDKLTREGFGDVTATVGDDFTVEKATEETQGKITGTVTVEKGQAKGTVDFELEIPIDTGKGYVDKDIRSGEGAPKAELPMEIEEMADAVFTETEWQEIEAGKDIKLLLTVDNIEEGKVSAEDAEKITKGASYYTVGQYLDINLLKTVSSNGVEEGEPTKITSTGNPIRIAIYIPDSLKGDGNKVRTYAVIRLHDGETTLLEDLDDDPDTVTIETDRFSTYAMVYTELTNEDRVAGAEEKLKEILKGLTATNDTTEEDIEKQLHDKLTEAGYGDVTVTVEFTEKDGATTEKEGSLKGTATVSKGTASGQPMLWEATIEKVTETLPSASPSVEPTADPQKTPGVTASAVPTVTPDGNDNDENQKVGLMPELKVTQKGQKIQVEWGKAAGADGYLVYVQYCGKKFAKKATKTIKKSSTTKVKIAKVGGKKLKLKKNFKVYVAAYKMSGGKRVVIKKTMTGHIVGKQNYKYTNAKKVKATKSKITLKLGKTAKIKAKTVRVDRKKKLLTNKHGKKYRYRSVDDSIVTVSKSGKITAVGKGSCSVYVFAQNGCAKKIKVTVK